MPRNFRDLLIFFAFLAIIAGFIAAKAFGAVTIEPPAYRVVAGEVSLFELPGFTRAHIPAATIKCEPPNGFIRQFTTPEGNPCLWFRPARNGPCVIGVAISSGIDTPAILVMVLVDVGGDGPEPDPDPDPDPKPDPDPEPDPEPDPDPDPTPPPGRRIVIIIERSTPIPTPEQAKVLRDLDRWKEAEGYTPETYRIADPDLEDWNEKPAEWLQPWLKALQQRGVKHPAIIVDAAPFGSVEAYDVIIELPVTGAKAIEVVEEAGG